MERLMSLLQGSTCQHLVGALLHTLWQGLVLGAILYGVLRRLSARHARFRYGFALLTLCLVVLAGLLTWAVLDYQPRVAPVSSESVVTSVSESVSSSPEPSLSHLESAPSAPSQAHRPWQAWAMAGWIIGAVVMLMRVVKTLTGGHQLRSQCHALESAEQLDLIEALCQQMHLKRPVRVLVHSNLSVPGVIGCLWPTLLLPMSLTTGMPLEDLKAIVTHELAHIKRYDYLVNLFQMVIEALLFFNPTVWWISRQIRIEREACCDAVGIAATGQRMKYAEVLVAWTQRLRSGDTLPGAVAWAEPNKSSSLVDRLKRIVVAGHRPVVHLSWPVAGLALGLSLVCLLALWQGANLAVTVAAEILTPQERIEKIREILQSYGYDSGSISESNGIEVSGTIRTWDGKPLPENIFPVLDIESGYNSCLTQISATRLSDTPDKAEFHTQVKRGQFWISLSVEGYARACAGPFESRPGHDINDIELILENGFVGRIQVVNEAAQPIEDALLKGGYTSGDNKSYQITLNLKPTAQGLCQLDHASRQTMTLSGIAPGYEPQIVSSVILDPNDVYVIVLKESHPITGTVVAQETGLPIANTEIRLLMGKRKSINSYYGHINKTPDTVTDAQGHFILDQVRTGSLHMIHITAQGREHLYLEDLPAGQEGLMLALGPQKILRGKILGDLSQLEQDDSGHPIVSLQNAHTGYTAMARDLPVTIQDGVGTFETDKIWGQTVTLKAAYQEIELKPQQDRLDNIVIDLKQATREVILQFDIPADMPPIQGQVRIDRVKERVGGHLHSHEPDFPTITDNQVTFTSIAPGQFSYGMARYKKMPVGYWFEDGRMIDVPIGSEPLVIHVPVYPAGAIYGSIFRPDGTVAKKAKASLRVVKQPDFMKSGLGDLLNLLSNRTNLGTYNATPLPLGGTYAIMAYEGYSFAITEPFTLDQANPTIEVNLQLSQGVNVTGRLLDEHGQPATNPVSLHVSVKRGEVSSGLGGAEIEPDADGRFVFENVNPGPGGECVIRVIGQSGYRPVKRTLQDLTQPVILKLELGYHVSGTVIDQATGWPVPGVEVYAMSVKDRQGDFMRNSELLEADAVTDASGHFEFTNMDTCFYRLNVRGCNLADKRQPVVVQGGQQAEVSLQVELPSWSDLTPRQPD